MHFRVSQPVSLKCPAGAALGPHCLCGSCWGELTPEDVEPSCPECGLSPRLLGPLLLPFWALPDSSQRSFTRSVGFIPTCFVSGRLIQVVLLRISSPACSLLASGKAGDLCSGPCDLADAPGQGGEPFCCCWFSSDTVNLCFLSFFLV